MPSSPRKKARAKPREACKHVEDSDSDESFNSMPPLVHSDSDDSRDEWPHRHKAGSNAESVEMWLDLSKATRDRHVRVMKIYLLSPFLFDSIEQDDKWINWAHESRLLSNKRNCEPSVQIQDCIEAVDIIEEAFSKVIQYILNKEDSEEIEKALGMLEKINTLDKLENAIICAESFPTFLKIRERIKTANLKRKGDTKRKADTSLLLVFQQIYDHIRKLTREATDLTKNFEDMCRQGEQQSTDLKKKGNSHFMDGKYKAAISAYSKALIMSQYNHILYGNRAQSYLRTGELWQALADGRRAVVLKAEWVKGQYRYAQAFFDLGDIERAISTNRAAKQSCQRNSKDLDSQFERFLKERDIRAKKVAKCIKKQEVQLKMPNDLEDLPDLVDAESTDTSKDSSDDEHDDDHEDDDDIDSSDISNSEYESVPELVTDSSTDSESDDCEEKKDIVEEKLKSQDVFKSHMNSMSKADRDPKTKRRKEKKLKQDTPKRKQVEISEGVQKKRDLNSALKLGSNAYLEGKWQASIHYYGEAVQLLSVDDPFQVFKIKHIDYILILYSHGTACLETGIHKELLEAIRQFEIITFQYKDVKFPLGFYGLGRVYHRQNRFSDALQPLNKGLNMLKTGEEFGEYRWPGTQTIIAETQPGKLEIAFETIIAICQHPPRPDAICRFTYCHGRTAIYLTDPDYKGYVRLICSESCKIDYHPTCWKKYRSEYGDKSGDKDYLEDECMTPDCTAIVVQMQIYGSEGLKTEFAVENVRTKQKQSGKIKTHGNQKYSKVEKQKKEDTKTEEPSDDITNDETKKEETTNHNVKYKPTNPKPEKEVEAKKVTKKTIQQDTRENKEVDPGVYILRKNEERLPEDLLVFKGTKGKSKKKKVKNVQSLDEFLKDHGGEVFKSPFGGEEEDEKPTDIPTMIPPSEWSEDELVAPFAVPAHLRSEVQAFEREYHAGIEPSKDMPSPKEKPPMDPIEDYLVSMYVETLNAYGPLDIADARIIEAIPFLDEAHQQRIHECGGIKQFLMKCEQFVVKGNVVMLPDELHFQEIVKNVNRFLKDTKSDVITNASKADDANFTGFNASLLSVPQENGHVPSLSMPLPPLQTSLHLGVQDFAANYCSSIQGVPGIQCTAANYCSSRESVPIQCAAGHTANSVFRDGVFTVEELSPKACDVEKPTAKPVVVCDDKELNGFHASLEKIGIPPTSDGIVKLTTDMDLNGVNNITEDKKPLEKDMGISGLDTFKLPDQHVNQISLPLNRNQETNFPLDNNAAIKMETEKCVDTKIGGHDKIDSLKHIRGGSTASDNTVGFKSKGIQTQLQVKSKGIMTDTMPEPFKVEYLKAAQERDEMQRKLQEVTDKLNNCQRKQDQELEKMKKKFSDIQIEKEKFNKELQCAKQEGKSELQKMEKICEEKEKLATSLEQRFKIEQERYQSTISGLRTELDAKELEFENERAKLNSTISQKEEAIKKANATKQQQECRSQDAEVKLLELRRDVGLKFLERSIQEATYTANNLITVRKASSVPSSKLDELISSWKLYFLDCQQKANICKNTFNVHIQEVNNGCTLSSLPQLTIPGPAAYPSQPILQLTAPVVTQIQSTFQLQLAPMEIPPNVSTHVLPPAAQHRPVAPKPVPSVPSQRMPLSQNGPPAAQHRPVAPKPVPSVPSQRMPLSQNGPPAAQHRPVAPKPVPSVPSQRMPLPQNGPPAAQHRPVAPKPVPSVPPQRMPLPQNGPPAAQYRPVAPQPVPSVPPQRMSLPQNGPPVAQPQAAQVPVVAQQVQHNSPEGTSAAAGKLELDSKGRPSNSFERIMLRLSTAYPYLARAELTALIKEVRQSKNGTLTGLSLEEIVQSVDVLIGAKVKGGAIRFPPSQQPSGPPGRNTQPRSSPVANGVTNSAPPAAHPTTLADSVCQSNVGLVFEEDDPCVICHDDMRSSLETVTALECGHKYHNKCIRKWLIGEQSTCPTCRVHALLPDEFPRLK